MKWQRSNWKKSQKKFPPPIAPWLGSAKPYALKRLKAAAIGVTPASDARDRKSGPARPASPQTHATLHVTMSVALPVASVVFAPTAFKRVAKRPSPVAKNLITGRAVVAMASAAPEATGEKKTRPSKLGHFFIAIDVGYYLPAYEQVSIYFLKDLVASRKRG